MSAEEAKVEEVEMVEEVAAVEVTPTPAEIIADVEDEEMKPEAPKDAESDELPCDEPRYAEAIKLNAIDGTLNCIVTNDIILSGLNIDQMHLLASCRCNVGIRGGRYLFETEIMQVGTQSEVRLGFSLADSSIFLGDKGTMAVSSNGMFVLDGTTQLNQAYKPRRLLKGDVVGLLINRTEEGNANTVSVFINGERHSLAQKIPESFDGALFPHVQVKGAVVSVNVTKDIMKKLPFECRMIADASKKDITPSTVKETSETEIITSIGFDTAEWVENYCLENPTDNFVHITEKFMHEWQEKSAGSHKRQILGEDVLKSLFKIMGLRKRKYIYTLANNLLTQDRKTFCERFPSTVNKITIIPEGSIEKLPANLAYYKDVTLPTEEEGWNHVLYPNTSVAKATQELTKWHKQCKNQTKVEDFKASDKLKEKITEWEKFVASTKKDAVKQKKEREIALKLANGETVEEEPKKEEEKKEEKKEGEEKKEEEEEVTPSSVCTIDFSEEDWMLARLRMELHVICHAFVEDVEDKERTAFSADFFTHYYKLYAPTGLNFYPGTFGCKQVVEVAEMIKDTIKLESNMLFSVLNADASFDDFVQKTEDARQERVDRIGAGDEGAQLKFKAQRKGAKGKGGDFQSFNKGAQRGGKGVPQMQQRVQQQRPQTFNKNSAPAAKGAVKGSFSAGKGAAPTYAMRTIPGAAAGMKRIQTGNVPQSVPKRIR